MAGGGGPVGAKVKKVSGQSTGRNAGMPNETYGHGPIGKQMIGTKHGIVDKPGPFGSGYTGPDVQRGEFP